MARSKKEWKIDFNYNLKVYWSLLQNYKLLFIGMIFLIIIIETSYVADKFLFKELIDKGTEFVAGSLPKQDFAYILFSVAVVFGLVVLVRSVTKWLHMHAINQLDGRLIQDLKQKFFSHLIHLSHSFHTSHKTGSLISRLVRGGSAVERMTDVIVFNFTPLLVQMIVVGVSLLIFDSTSSFIVLAMVIVFLGYSLAINRLQQKANLAANNAEDTEKANIGDIFTNIDSIKYFAKEEAIKHRYGKLTDKTRRSMVKNWNYFRWLDAGHVIILGVGTLLLLYFPLMKFLNGSLSLGSLVFIYTVYGNLTSPLFGFVHGIRNFYRAMADFESLFQYAKIENEVKDKPHARELRISQGVIEFRDVDFTYNERKIISGFSLKIGQHKKVAIVGPSGGGKSTLVKLLYRLYDLDKGQILIDGNDITAVRQHSLRSELSIVPQECILFDETIAENIRFSKPTASMQEIRKAMRFAQLDKVVRDFPNKEHTIVGERGVKLSGGEKQRVSIARAILADKKVLILDEATSSLDSETENEIQRDLEKLMKGRTTIIIAHRLSTIMKADVIVVVDKGRIIQQGTHAELIKQEGIYQKLWTLQKGGYLK
ncbi:MAG: ABC transporter ATP-binding protein [Nanoarchaeota archaeon]